MVSGAPCCERSCSQRDPVRCLRGVAVWGRLAEWLVAVSMVVSSSATGWCQDSPDFFRQNCVNCHTIGGGRLAGPDLKGVSERRGREWLVGFMMDPKSYLDRGDPDAIKLLEESRNVLMPTIPGMTRERCENLLDLIEAESQLAESQFKGLQISNKPFTAADRTLGRAIFLGTRRLEAGGAACISCHGMHDLPALGGGRLGPDLTQVYERLEGRKALSAWLVAPGTTTMQPIFKNHPMSRDEIQALVAYFAASAGDSPAQPVSSRMALLLMGLLGAAAAVFGFDAVWKRRFHGVRQSLVDTASSQSPRPGKVYR